jgi:hypothetical protein
VTVAVDPLSAKRFYNDLTKLRASGFLGGSATLFALQRQALTCMKTAEGAAKVACFVLAAIFESLARRSESEASDAEHAAHMLDVLEQPLAECAALVAGHTLGVNAEQVLANAVAAYAHAVELE